VTSSFNRLFRPSVSCAKPHAIHRWQFGAESFPGVAAVFSDPNAPCRATKGECAAISGDVEAVAEDEMIGVLLGEADAES
jgi:hypothetical protein